MNKHFTALLLTAVMTCTHGVASASVNGINISPEPGVVGELSEFHLTFDGDWALGPSRNKAFIVTGPEGVTIPRVMSYSLGADGGYMAYFDDDVVLTTPGNYTFTVPQGKFSINGEDVPETTFEYVVEAGSGHSEVFPEYAIDPESGTYIAIDNEIAITFDTDKEISVTQSLISFETATDAVRILAEAEGTMVKIYPVDATGAHVELATPGNYLLTLQPGAIRVGDVANSTVIQAQYTIIGYNAGSWTGEITSDPADNATVESLKEVNVTFVGAGNIIVSDTAAQSQFPYLVNDATGAVVTRASVFATGNVLNVSLNSLVDAAGNYTLTLPAGLFLIDGAAPTSALTLHFNIAAHGSVFDYTYTLNPASGGFLDPYTEIEITFAGDEVTSVENNMYAWGKDAPYFTNEMGAYNPNILIAQNGLSFMLSHQWPFEVEGEYKLVIPAGYFTLLNAAGDKVSCTDIVATYSVMLSGIENVSASPASADVYNTQGICVMRNASAESLRTLPAGIYLISGKKLLVK